MKSNRVLAAMSGGVDSSVAAAILKNQGYEVIGVSMQFWGHENRCCSEKDLQDAQAVSKQLKIPHHILSLEKIFKKEIVDYFVSDYLKGRTPNPCVVCNKKIKFDILLKKADELNAQCIATGHYVILEDSEEFKTKVLKRSKEKRKDQSYFLARLNKTDLQRALFPLGSYAKSEIRDLARKLNLPVHEKDESQEVCFVPDGNLDAFIKRQLGKENPPKGLIINEEGQRIGSHDGISGFTIGQRKGLGIAIGKPAYVTRIDAESNTVVVGDREDLYDSCFLASDPQWINREMIKEPSRFETKIRYRHQAQWAEVFPRENNRIKVRFDTPQRAITPGQLAVFYDNDIVVGSAWIEKVVT
ncbi:MAG: tRNA 2-thiouridine(34) synthase MnmA [bacterium]